MILAECSGMFVNTVNLFLALFGDLKLSRRPFRSTFSELELVLEVIVLQQIIFRLLIVFELTGWLSHLQ